MSEGRHIRAIGDRETPTGTAEANAVDPEAMREEDHIPSLEQTDGFEGDDKPAQRPIWSIAIAIIALLLVAAWTTVFAAGHWAEISRPASIDKWTSWIADWSVPPLLIAIAWLIAMRSSSREASRFGNAARALSEESALLEARLTVVNRELSLAREFLAAQSRELDYLGRAAAEKISEHASKLQDLVVSNGAQVDAIAGVSVTALENMTQLRDGLPVVANSARDVSNQIGGAGRTAKAHLDELVGGFKRLNEFGEASERQVASLRERIDDALTQLDGFARDIDEKNSARLGALREILDGHRADLDAREVEVLAAMRQRGDTLRDELVAAHDARQLEEAAALAAMRNRIAAFKQEAHDLAAAVRAGEQAAKTVWEGQISDLHNRLETTLREIALLDEQALDRAQDKLAALAAEAEAIDTRMLERDREFQARVAARSNAFEEAEEAARARIIARGDELDREMADRYAEQMAHITGLGEAAETLATRLSDIEAHVVSISGRASDAGSSLARNSNTFADTVRTHANDLAEAEAALARLTDASVRLLELIQATAKHSRDELPVAIENFETKLGNARGDSEAVKDTLAEANRLAEDINRSVGDMHQAGQDSIDDLDALRARLTGTTEEQVTALEELRVQLSAADQDSRALAAAVSDRLASAVASIKEDSRVAIAEFERSHGAAIESLRERSAEADRAERENIERTAEAMAVSLGRLRAAGAALFGEIAAGNEARVLALAESVADSSADAIDRAIQARTEDSLARLDEATVQSTEAARQAVADMRDQLARVHELTVNLESRAARAREQVEEQVDSDFSRRMALITESLNSHSIDIAKALSTEVTDTAWSSYLKGDRGIFTRRAVRLIDNSDARVISDLYEGDHEFREHVSRYIHDFESMLRTMLSTRDGHALGVTLLSSDMGKLYVALAQSIQRLRQ